MDSVEFNPVLDWCKHLVFPLLGRIDIKRKEEFGGDLSFDSYDELVKEFLNGNLHPIDLKNGVADSIIKILKPAREHFEIEKNNRSLDSLKKVIQG